LTGTEEVKTSATAFQTRMNPPARSYLPSQMITMPWHLVRYTPSWEATTHH